MPRPKRMFIGSEGEHTIGLAGAAGLRGDLDNAFRMFDPDMRFSDGSSGGIGTINLQDKGIINDNFADKSLNASKLEPECGDKLARVVNPISPIVNPKDSSVQLFKKSGVFQKNEWPRKTEEIPLFVKSRAFMPSGEREYYSRFIQNIKVKLSISGIMGFGGVYELAPVPVPPPVPLPEPVSFSCRVVVLYPKSGGVKHVVWENSTVDDRPKSGNVSFNPFDHIPFNEDATFQIIMERPDPSDWGPFSGQLSMYLDEFSVAVNKTLITVPMGSDV